MNQNLHIDAAPAHKRLSAPTGGLFVLLALCVTLASCVSLPARPADEGEAFGDVFFLPGEWKWTDCGVEGIDRLDYAGPPLGGGQAVRWHCVRVALDRVPVQLVAYPSVVAEDGIYPALPLKSFAADADCVVALNTTPFDRAPGGLSLAGVHLVQGALLSPPQERYAALVLLRRDGELRAAVLPQQSDALAAEGVEAAFGGFFAVLISGEAQPFAVRSYDRRSAAGVSDGGRTLYLLAVEGRPGLSYQQCARLFAALGCTDAIEFDGGRSADLWVCGSSVLTDTPVRPQAAGFGFRLP